MNLDRSEPSEGNGFQTASAQLILDSYRRLTGRQLVSRDGSPVDQARAMYFAPFVVLAHDSAADPVFFYANMAAQHLFEMSWHELVQLPSRYSAEPLAREERARLLQRVGQHGFIDDYSGVRVARSGKRFEVRQATVWSLLALDGQLIGQAASFSQWEILLEAGGLS